MTNEMKLELLRNKLMQLVQASVKKDPKADVLFLSLFNAVKDNDVFFSELAAQAKVESQEALTKLQSDIAKHEANITTMESLTVAKEAKN